MTAREYFTCVIFLIVCIMIYVTLRLCVNLRRTNPRSFVRMLDKIRSEVQKPWPNVTPLSSLNLHRLVGHGKEGQSLLRHSTVITSNILMRKWAYLMVLCTKSTTFALPVSSFVWQASFCLVRLVVRLHRLAHLNRMRYVFVCILWECARPRGFVDDRLRVMRTAMTPKVKQHTKKVLAHYIITHRQ